MALAPEVLLAGGASSVRTLQAATNTIPIVFAGATDPVGGGLVESLAQPGGNSTGFTNFEYGIATKWVELLKQIKPTLTRVSAIRDSVGGGAQFGAIQGVASSFGVTVSPVDSRDPGSIERALTTFARAGWRRSIEI